MRKLITAILFFLSFNLFAQDNVDLFIWAGQSNALGRKGDAAQYPADPGNLDPTIRFNWTVPNGGNSGGWTTMGPQDIGHYFDAGHFGPEVTFSRGLVQAGYNPAIFKYTQGATSIFEHWLNPGSGGLYDDMVTALEAAILELEAQGHDVTIRGLIWIQGESDSNSDAAANAYYNNLSTLLHDFRNNVVHNANLPIILGVDEQFFDVDGHQRPQVLNAHQDIALNDNHIKFTSMYGYPKADGDFTHLTPAGLISHGEDLFDAYQLLISGEQLMENCTLSSAGDSESFERASWGQSFTTDCSGQVASITFSAASALNNAATFTLYNSADCSGTALFSQTMNNIVVGNNTVIINNGLYLDKEHTYYLEIVSEDINAFWRIHYSNVDNVFGMLRTFQDGSNCGRSFPSFDMNFSVSLNSNATSGCTFSSAGSEISFERASWGQSFISECAGNVNSITFSAASPPNEPATFTLYDGDDCSGTILFSETLNAITTGNNLVIIDAGVILTEGDTYFFQIVSKNDALWRIHYNNTDLVEGMLYTFQDGNYCGRTFPSFDMNFSVVLDDNGDCAHPENVYSFNYDGRTYQVVKENKTWVGAAACAVSHGGILAEINDQAEQDAIFNELQNNADIDLANTVAPDGGHASYVWLGGNDLDTEELWGWDGDNNHAGILFWQGGSAANGGMPIGGQFSNWGNEPDNWNDDQDAVGIALTQWPINTGSLGSAGQWNDIAHTNTLYFLIEYDHLLTVDDFGIDNIKVYPNPVKNTLTIEGFSRAIDDVRIINSLGQLVKYIRPNTQSEIVEIDFSNISNGIYFININYKNGAHIMKKVIK